MSSFTVNTPELAAAAVQINGSAATVGSARSAAASASGQAGAFGGEPIEAAFIGMCNRALSAMQEIETTIHQLSGNVAAAAVGYIVTDQGIVPVKDLFGAKP
jgi:uncharacterized protein YukE